MAGIFGGISLNNYRFKEEKLLKHDELLFNNYSYGRKYIDKFNNERFILESNEYICVFEGFLFNIEDCENQKEYFESHIKYSSIDSFIKGLDGIFAFSIFFKKEKKIFLVTDHLATMKVFYSLTDKAFIYSSDLFDITSYYKSVGDEIDLDTGGIYFFLGFGSIVSDKTLFKDIKKLEPSTYLEFDVETNEYTIIKYHTLDFTKNNNSSENEIIDKYEEILSASMNRIVELNDKYKLEHLAGLSGGLDSKSMVIMMKEKVQKLTTFTFAQYGSSDQKIAQKVASSLGTIHNFVSLDNGNCLEHNLIESITATSGLVALHTVLHGYNSFLNINTNQFGLLLTGQIGDAIFGSHFIGSKKVKEYITSKSHYGIVPEFIYKKISFIDELLIQYSNSNSEAYIYEGRISNGTVYGDIALRNRVDSITPFYSKKLLDFTLSVPEALRINEDIYIKWFSKYYPSMLSFKWDKCNCTPTSKFKVRIFKYFFNVKNAIKKRLRLKYDGMNPFDTWYRENKNILLNLDNIYNDNISILNFSMELKDDVAKVYNSDLDRYKRNKFVVVTLLLSLKLHLKKFNNE
jgi:asparagine synthase (glutamine-hydrolysing)